MSILDLTHLFRWAIKARNPSEPRKSGGALLGSARDGRSVTLPVPGSDRAAHILVLAASGAGKTQMMAGALLQEMERDLARPARERAAFFIADPKGDLVSMLMQHLAQGAPELLDKTHYLEPFQYGFPLNLCRSNSSIPVEIQAMALSELVGSVSTAVGAQGVGLGQRQVDTLHHLLLAALTVPHEAASPLLALDALSVPDGFAELASLTTHPRAREFLESAKPAGELRASTASRLRSAFAPTSLIERLFVTSSCIDYAALCGPGNIVILDVGTPPGGRMSLRRFFANSTARLALDYAMSRPSPWSGNHLRCVFDELQLFGPVLADIAEDILTTGRSRGVSLVGLSQGTVLLGETAPEVLQLLLGNAPNQIYGRLAAKDAELLARSFGQAPGVDESLSGTRARFVASVTNLADRAFFDITPGDRVRFRSKDLPPLSDPTARQRARIEDVKRRHALPAEIPRITLSELASSAIRRQRHSLLPAPNPGRGRGRWG